MGARAAAPGDLLGMAALAESGNRRREQPLGGPFVSPVTGAAVPVPDRGMNERGILRGHAVHEIAVAGPAQTRSFGEEELRGSGRVRIVA
jgi:hypothetical protein